MANRNKEQEGDFYKTETTSMERCYCPNCEYPILDEEDTEEWGEIVNVEPAKNIRIEKCSDCQERIEITLIIE